MKKAIILLLIVIFGAGIGFSGGCAKKEKTLIVYAGKGLKKAMEDTKAAFEQKHNVRIYIIYAGSGNLLNTIKGTKKGDVFIPGSNDFIKRAGNLVTHHQYVASHIPTVSIHKDNPKNIRSFEDLARHGVRLVIGNADMCAIGRAADNIIARSRLKDRLVKNTVIKASTVDELLSLLNKKEADAAIIWADMLNWPEAEDLKGIEIPPDLNDEITKINVAVLTTSKDKKTAGLFAQFVASEGKAIFAEHGFGAR